MLPDKCIEEACLADDLDLYQPWDQLLSAKIASPTSHWSSESLHTEQIQLLAQRVLSLETVVRGILPLLNQGVMPASVELKRTQLDRYCLPAFESSPEPTPMALHQLARRIEAQHPHVDSRSLLSSIRRWFRKKREEVGLKIITALRKTHPDSLSEKREEILSLITSEAFDMESLIHEARLALNTTPPLTDFCRNKILTFLHRKA